MLRAIATTTVLVCVLAPSPARADLFVEPFLATTRNKETARWVMGGGASATWQGGWIVAGGEVGYAAGYFDPPADALDLIASSHVLTVTGHAGVALPPKEEPRFLPYFTAGAGVMRQEARDREGLADVTRSDPALHVGGGVRVLITKFLGVSADVRQFRSLRDPYETPDPLVQDLERLNFWRITIGAVMRFGWD